MAIEIERKFLVKGDFTKGVFESERIVQGYICSTPGRTVRVRIRGKAGFLTIKGPSDEKGLSRYEFEQQISLSDANQLMKLCESGVIDKVRNLVHCGKRVWEIDVFHGRQSESSPCDVLRAVRCCRGRAVCVRKLSAGECRGCGVRRWVHPVYIKYQTVQS